MPRTQYVIRRGESAESMPMVALFYVNRHVVSISLESVLFSFNLLYCETPIIIILSCRRIEDVLSVSARQLCQILIF